MHIQFSGKEALLQQLQDYLRDKASLLLLDNMEHLLPQAADFLVELLQAAPQLKLMATSRHSLNLQAASVVRLVGLPTPSLQEAPTLTPTALLASSSVALFVERAQRAQPTFRVTPTNQAAIVQICHFVNGLPLAIELAATQTRKYACQQILAELQKSYTVLNSTWRDLAPRHRSIRAMLDYSWQFLSPETAHLLAACSIFQGAFDSAAVAAIIGGAAMMNVAPEALFMLVEQSLVQLLPTDESAEQPRFALHELIRQYGAEQLQTQSAEMHRLHTAHSRYYLTLLIEQSPLFVRELAALLQMQNELNNLRAAWTWAVTQKQWDLLLASTYPLRQFYNLLNLYHEAESSFGQAVAQIQALHAPDAVASPMEARVIAHLQAHQAHFCARLERFTCAEDLAKAALARGRQLDDPVVQGYAYLSLSSLYGRRTDWAGAQHAAEQALLFTRAVALPNVEVGSLQNIGCAYLYRGDTPRALDYMHRALAVSTSRRDLYLEGWLCLDLGNTYHLAGDLMQAKAYYQQVGEIYRQMNIPILGVYALASLSELYAQLGSFEQACAYAQQAWESSRSTVQRAAEATALSHLAYAYYQLGDWGQANHTCQMLFDRIKPLGLTFMRPFAFFMQGELWRSQGQWQAALAAYETARQDYTTIVQMARATSIQAKIAQVWFQVGELPKALAQVEEILPHLSPNIQNSWAETTADYWICYQVLAAAADPRAAAILQQGYQFIQAQVKYLTDEALRRAYLINVAANRSLMELAAQAGLC